MLNHLLEKQCMSITNGHQSQFILSIIIYLYLCVFQHGEVQAPHPVARLHQPGAHGQPHQEDRDGQRGAAARHRQGREHDGLQGAVRQVRQPAGPRVPEGRARGRGVQVLNIQPLSQVCPQQARGEVTWSQCIYTFNMTMMSDFETVWKVLTEELLKYMFFLIG